MHFTQASHKKDYQPNFDHFGCRSTPWVRSSWALNSSFRSRCLGTSPALREEQERVECYQALIMLYQTYGFVFLASHLLVQDESWFYWDSSERREVWVDPHGMHSITPKVGQTNRKKMMGFARKLKRVSISALPKGTTAYRSTMIEYLRTTGHRFNNLKNDKIKL